jgi:hypothetical protein
MTLRRSFGAVVVAICCLVAGGTVARSAVHPAKPTPRSPLSGSILFAGGPHSLTPGDLLAVDAAAGQLRLLVAGSDGGSWSPNGKLLAYSHYIPDGFYSYTTSDAARPGRVTFVPFARLGAGA